MPSLTTTIEDNSPIISYSAEWVAGVSSDPSLSSYSGRSFMVSDASGAKASFTFNGTSVQIFGAKRANHGGYQITLDGATNPPENGTASPNIFQTSLFSADSLEQKLHTVTLTNAGTPGHVFTDIDFITWQTNVGTTDEQLMVNVVQDTDPAFTYAPASGWSNSPKDVSRFLGNTGHSTSSPGASVTYAFEGAGVSLYGPTGPDYAAYSVQLDGGSFSNYTANQVYFTYQVLLYHVSNLDAGRHTLSVLYQPSESGQSLAVDYATVFTTPSMQKHSSGHRLPVGAIAGIAIGGVACMILILYGMYILYRRRHKRRKHVSFILEGTHGTENMAQSQPGPSLVPYGTRPPVDTTAENLSPFREIKGQLLPLPPSGQAPPRASNEDLRRNRSAVEGRPRNFIARNPSLGRARSEITLPPDYSQATEGYNSRRF